MPEPHDGEAHSRIEELEADNRRLRRLLDRLDAPGELRHRLRSTIALLAAIVRRSTTTDRDLHAYAAHLGDRLDAIARAQARADQFGEVDLRTLAADELLRYGVSEGERFKVTGPDVALTPRIGQVIALAIHELAVNAVEHGMPDAPGATIELSWSIADRGRASPVSMRIDWVETQDAGRETDGGEPPHRGFGTEVLTRMVPYELQAEARFTFGATELRYSVDIPDLSELGRLVDG